MLMINSMAVIFLGIIDIPMEVGVSFFCDEEPPSSLSTGTKEAASSVRLISRCDNHTTFTHENISHHHQHQHEHEHEHEQHTRGSSHLRLPVLRVLILTKALVVVTLGGKELLEVGLAIENPLHGSIVTKGEGTFAVRAFQAGLVESLPVFFILHHDFLCKINSLVADWTLLWSSSKLWHGV